MENPLVWIDLEMTGLDIKNDLIIEIAVIISDSQMKNFITGPEIIIYQPSIIMDNMNDWCKKTHGESGLTQKVKDSNNSMKEVEKQVLDFIKLHIPEPCKGILAGNSIHIDRQFLLKDMPLITDHLHFRIIDVSSIKELVKNWYPELPLFKKKWGHRALDDIKESIDELKYYRKYAFK